MTPLQTLKHAIQVACPEIMELKFGCEVEYNGKIYSYCGAGKAPMVFFRENYQGLDVVLPLPQYKILGRPIGLSEVLRAVGSLKKFPFAVDDQGFIWKWDSAGSGNWIPAKLTWNLSLPTIDDQKPELWEFVLKILTSKQS